MLEPDDSSDPKICSHADKNETMNIITIGNNVIAIIAYVEIFVSAYLVKQYTNITIPVVYNVKYIIAVSNFLRKSPTFIITPHFIIFMR